MEDHTGSTNGLLVRVKRSTDDLEERRQISTKRIKMTDCDSGNSKSLKRTVVPLTFNFDGSPIERSNGENLLPIVQPVPFPLDLNTEICSSDTDPKCKEYFVKPCSQESRRVTSNGIGLDLNVGDVSSSINCESIRHNHVKNLRPRDAYECGSSIGSVKEKDSLRVWKEMKQNGFLSSSHGGISKPSGLLSSSHGGIPVPKLCGRKSKNDELKKKMELAKKEQVDRFAKFAAPSGPLNGLNPGIINHVRNKKQVHSLIEGLVQSEKLEKLHSRSQQPSHIRIGTKDDDGKKDHGKMDDPGFRQLSFYHENEPPNITSMSNKARGYLVPIHKPISSRDGDSSMLDLISEDDGLTLKLSSSTKASVASCSLSNEESENISSAYSLSVKAATVASHWLELLQQDIKGRLSALQRSKKKVQAVITTDLPFLISKEFSSIKEDGPNIIRNSADGFSRTAEMHRERWSSLFGQMEDALSEEEKQLESWLDQMKRMQLHCDQGLQHMHWNIRSRIGDRFDGEWAIMAAAASIYSTCYFMLSKENVLPTANLD